MATKRIKQAVLDTAMRHVQGIIEHDDDGDMEDLALLQDGLSCTRGLLQRVLLQVESRDCAALLAATEMALTCVEGATKRLETALAVDHDQFLSGLIADLQAKHDAIDDEA
jgi:hypothetical protein